jgi:Protein of unknown function (DUF2889)
MPLSASAVEREHLHDRRYDFQGYRRKDGLWDIEGRMTDSKTYGFPNEFRGRIEAGEPLHDMRIRLTLDDHFVVRDIEISTDGAPFAICPDVAPNFAVVKGLKIGSGWNKKLKELLGGTRGCTHHVEMLGAMATVAYQTMWGQLARERNRAPEAGSPRRPAFLDTCHAFASDGEVVKKNWPAFYTGPADEAS